MLVAAADLEIILVPADGDCLNLHYLLEIYLLLVVGSQLRGVILPPAVDSFLRNEYGMVVAACDGQHLPVLQLGQHVRGDGLVAAPSQDATVAQQLDGELGFTDPIAGSACALAAGRG